MNWLLILLLTANVYLIFAWIWSLVTLSAYIKPGKGLAFALTPFWILASSWFTPEGVPYLQKARIHIGIPSILMTSIFLYSAYWD